jgi:hypothetical protein
MNPDQFKRDAKRDIFVPKGFEALEPNKDIEALIQSAQVEMAKKVDAFLEMSLKLVLPEEIVDLLGKNLHPRNQAFLNQLGIDMQRSHPERGSGNTQVRLFKRARSKKEETILIALMDIVFENKQIRFTSKVNRDAVNFKFQMTHPVIRRWLRELKTVGSKEAADLLEGKASQFVVEEVTEEKVELSLEQQQKQKGENEQQQQSGTREPESEQQSGAGEFESEQSEQNIQGSQQRSLDKGGEQTSSNVVDGENREQTGNGGSC